VIDRILKPHYVYRPTQAGRRFLHALSGSRPSSAVVTLPWGLPLRIDATEDVGRSIWNLGVHDLAVSETLWRLLGHGDLALDVGANIGHMTSLMAWRTGPGGRVLAFEPHPEVFRQLAENVALFGRHRSAATVECFPVAMGAAAGASFLECTDYFATHHGTARLTDHETPIPVRVTTLDEALGDRTAAVAKIDVEGGELGVLQGGARALAAGRVRSLVYEAYPAERQRLAGHLAPYGYRIFAVGWNLRGLLLSGPTEAPRVPGFQSPNFVATLDPDVVLPRLERRGWQVL
jgi:FkbM family methyltransferase